MCEGASLLLLLPKERGGGGVGEERETRLNLDPKEGGS